MVSTSAERCQRLQNACLARIVGPNEKVHRRQVEHDVAKGFVVLDSETCDHAFIISRQDVATKTRIS